MRTTLIAAAAVAIAATLAGMPSAADAAKEPYVLAPGSKWNVNFGETTCRLSRTFGSGPNTHVLILDQKGPSSGAVMTVAGPSFERFRVKKEASIDLGGSMAIEAEPKRAQLGSMRYGIVFPTIGFGDAAQLDVSMGNSIDYLTFTQRRSAVRLETGPLGEAFEVLNSCTKDMGRK